MSTITTISFVTTKSGEETHLYRITNSSGWYVEVTDLGAAITSIVVRDRKSYWRDITLSYSTAEGFEHGGEYFGATVGRCAGRIAKGQFTLNDKEYQLAINNGENHLHGGVLSFSRKVWRTTIKKDKVMFTLSSPDGDESYPSRLDVIVTYSFNDDNELSITWDAASDGDTICNLTNHVYFNLNGEGDTSILDNELKIDASKYIEVDEGLIPIGINKVSNTPFDFRHPKLIGEDIYKEDTQLERGNGYDHSFIIRNNPCVVASSPRTGITLTCTTDYPIVHLYSGNFVNVTSENGKNGHSYSSHAGFCLETQMYNDAINHPEYPSVILHKGEKYHHKTTYKFSVEY